MIATFRLSSSISRAAAASLAVVLLAAVAVCLVPGDLAVAPAGPLVSRSRAMVLACTGLLGCGDSISGDRVSSSPLFGELTCLSEAGADGPFSVPDADPPEGFRSVLDFEARRPGAKDKRPGAAFAVDVADLGAKDDDDTCLVVLEAGRLGGAIDVRLAPTDGRGCFTPAEATRLALEGVFVRDVAALDEAVANCLVGDFVGDC